jgi:hypothetical protein
MSFLTNLEALFQKDETWVINFFATLKRDEAIVEADAVAAFAWMSAHGSEIAADLTALVALAAKLGLGLPPPISAALAGLNIAVALVNQAASAAVAAKASGSTDTNALVAAAVAGTQAYNQLKAAEVLVSTAQAGVATSGVAPAQHTAAAMQLYNTSAAPVAVT